MSSKSLSSHKKEEPERNVLYIVGTPIGNLSDISLRALKILKNVSLIACEDTRQTKKIMERYNFANKLISFNKNNSYKKIPPILNYLESGDSIALVSDAGLPGICDPGEDLINRAKANRIDVICIPGPCAALTALVSSGLPSSKFIFEGFLPTKKTERDKTLLEISNNLKTTIIFESPHRLKKLLQELKNYCGGSRKLQVAKELTKKFEKQIGQDINEVIEFFEYNEQIGEYTIILDGIKNLRINEYNPLLLKSELHELINLGLSLNAASKYLAKKNNIPKRIIYNLE